MKTTSFLILLLLLFAGNLSATNYFVDADNGNDADSGKINYLGIIKPWKSITKVNNYNFTAGDIISFKCGQRFMGITLRPPSSGTANSFIVFNSYGTGARPVIDKEGYTLPNPINDIQKSNNQCLDLYFLDNNKSYLKFDGLKFVHGWGSDIVIKDCAYLTFNNCNIDSSFQSAWVSAAPGMLYMESLSNAGTHHITITNSSINYSQYGHGLYINGISQLLMEHDTIMNNGANGIQTVSTDTIGTGYVCYQDTIRYCIIAQNDQTNHYQFQIFDNAMKKSAIYYNVIEGNTTSGSNSTLVRITNNYRTPPRQVGWYNNTMVRHGISEVFDWGGDSWNNGIPSDIDSIWIRNNVIYLDNTSGYAMYFYGAVGSHNIITNNNYYYPEGVTHVWHGSNNTDYVTLFGTGSWNSYSSYESKSVTDGTSTSTFNSNFTNLQLKNGSNAVLAGINVGLTQDITGKPIGNPPDIGAYQNSTYITGTLSSNQTLSGNVAMTGAVTVPSGITLTISPGTNVKIENGEDFTIHGTLQCQYNSSQGNITIDTLLSNNSQGSIIFENSSASNSVLQYVTINHLSEIECLNGANVQIQNDSLINSMDGIYIYNSAPQIINNIILYTDNNGIYGDASGLGLLIQGNTITRSSDVYDGCGIFMGNSTYSDILNNNISGFAWGAYLGGGSITATGSDMDITCNNNISGNYYGLGTAWGGTTFWGQDDRSGIGNSTYSNISYDTYTYQHSYLMGYYDYWGGNTNFYTDGTSTTDIGTFIPNPCSGSEQSITNIPSNPTLSKSGNDNFLAGLKLEKQGKIDEAIAFYKNLINEDSHTIFALTRLMYLNNKNSRPEIIDYFNSILSSNSAYYGKIKKLVGDNLIQNNQFDKGIMAFNDAINNSLTVYDKISARFLKLFACLNIKKDPSTASQLLSEIKGFNSEDAEVQMSIKIAENLIKNTNKVLSKKTIISGENIPKAYCLSQNFPNPFNPETTIRFQIPKPGLVTLKVYDILGREVTTLVNENMVEGTYSFTFNASRYSSGVYIYQLKVNDYVSSKKMVLLK
jgi:tetratricopeptide (TPR) repeat protein